MKNTNVKKYQNSGVMMTRSQAIAHNKMTPNNAFMYGIGSEEDPAFLYPEELEPAVVTASGDAYRKKLLNQQVTQMMHPTPKVEYVDQVLPAWYERLWSSITRPARKIGNGLSHPFYTSSAQFNRMDVPGTNWYSNLVTPELSHDPTVIDLSTGAYSTQTDDGAEGVDLFNDYVELTNSHVHPAYWWAQRSPDYLLRDSYDMPLGNISLFQGVENGTYKLMPLQDFNKSTIVVPARSTGIAHPRVTEAIWRDGKPLYRFENDTTATALPFEAKGTIGNSAGGLFVNRPHQIDSSQVMTINKFLQQNGPAWANGQDSGSMSNYETYPGTRYLDQGVGGEDSTLIFGKYLK